MSDTRRPYLTRNHEQFLAVVDRLREDRGLSWQAISKRLGLSRSQAGRWRTGQNLPDTPTLWRLADALDYDIALIPRRTEEQP